MKRLVFLASLLIYPTGVFAHSNDSCWMGRWGGMMGCGHSGMFFVPIFLILVGMIFYVFIQKAKSPGQDISRKETPLEILKKRYVKGEIIKEEFEKTKKDLEN